MVLFLKNLLFTLIVPGTVAVYLPLWIVQPCGCGALAVGTCFQLFVVLYEEPHLRGGVRAGVYGLLRTGGPLVAASAPG